MKLFVFIFCICYVQLCLASFGLPSEVKLIRDSANSIDGVSKKFTEDINAILEKYPNNPVVIDFLKEFIPELADLSKKSENSTIHVNEFQIKSKDVPDYKILDNANILQTILSKQLPSERFNGLVNLIYAVRPSATSEEVQSALNYLYGIEAEAPFHNISETTSKDCLNSFESRLNGEALTGFKALIDIKPKVVEDVTAITNRFPCQYKVASYLEYFARQLLSRLNGNTSKIDACKIEAAGEDGLLTRKFDIIESVLQTRLPDETIRGILNLIKTFRSDVSMSEIQKALEYLYADVPQSDCTNKGT